MFRGRRHPGLFLAGGFLRAASKPRGHLEKEPAVGLVDSAEKTAELLDVFGILAGAAPERFVRRLPNAKLAGSERPGPVVEKLVNGDFESFGPFFKRFNSGNGVSILDAREIRALQARAVFDFALRQFLLFAESAEAFADNHEGIITLR